MKVLLRPVLSTMLFAILFASCDTTDCISFSTRILIVDFLDSATGSPVAREFELITSTESGIPFYSDTTLSKLYLPVNTEVGQTSFLLFNQDTTIDTLTVGYDLSQRLISEDCGFELLFRNVRIINSTFKSAVSLENELSRLNEENVKIYF